MLAERACLPEAYPYRFLRAPIYIKQRKPKHYFPFVSVREQDGAVGQILLGQAVAVVGALNRRREGSGNALDDCRLRLDIDHVVRADIPPRVIAVMMVAAVLVRPVLGKLGTRLETRLD